MGNPESIVDSYKNTGDGKMSYLIKEKMVRDKSDQGDSSVTDLAVGIEDDFSVKKKGRIEESASFETKKEDVDVADYHHFPADNIAEVWLNIFEKLDAEDKITFSKTCNEWHDWVASKRKYFHFSEVVPMLVQTKNLHQRELVRCRTICKSWTSDFNRVYLAHPAHLRLDTENNQVEENQISELNNYFSNSEQIQQFLKEMNSHPGNPFPGRSICLQFQLPNLEARSEWADPLSLLREYYEKAIELLKGYGSHVHIAAFHVWDYDEWYGELETEVMEFYDYFRSCLFHMPNLRKLVASAAPVYDMADHEEDLTFYRENTLPQLSHLETVCMKGMYYEVCNGVLESCCIPSNIKRLLLSSSPDTDEIFLKRIRMPQAAYFPNLEAFHFFLPDYHWERFLSVLEGTHVPPVGTVYLECWKVKQNFGSVFRRLEIFAGSLTCLQLCADFTYESLRNAVASGFTINLPQLERLELEDFKINAPLDPFCQLSSLKVLTIECAPVQRWEGSREDFYGFEERLEESNIWEKIPTLQELWLGGPYLWKFDTDISYHRDNFLRQSDSECSAIGLDVETLE